MEAQANKNKISEHRPDFLRYCHVEKRTCNDTVKTYHYAIEQIINLVGDISVLDINQYVVLELKEKMLEAGLSDNRQSLVVSVLKNYLMYLSQFSGLEVYDYLKVVIPKVKSKPVEYLTQQEIDDFINFLPEKNLREKRFKALVAMLASSGARINELLGLKKDIDIDSRETVVLGKGSKYRKIYFDDVAIHYLKLYLNERNDSNPFLFATVNSGYGDASPLDKNDVNKVFRRYSKKLGKRIHCHIFRASFLTNCLHQNIPVAAVSKAMGHSDIRTSMRYFAPMSDPDTKAEFEKFFTSKANIEARSNIKNLTNL